MKVIGAVSARRLGADLSRDPRRRCRWSWSGDHRVKVVPEFADFYGQFGAELPLSRGLVAFSTRSASSCVPILAGVVGGGRRRSGAWFAAAGPAQAAARACCCGCRSSARSLTKFATAQFARTLATLLPAAFRWSTRSTSRRASIGNRSIARARRVVTQQVREGQPLRGALERAASFPTSR